MSGICSTPLGLSRCWILEYSESSLVTVRQYRSIAYLLESATFAISSESTESVKFERKENVLRVSPKKETCYRKTKISSITQGLCNPQLSETGTDTAVPHPVRLVTSCHHHAEAESLFIDYHRTCSIQNRNRDRPLSRSLLCLPCHARDGPIEGLQERRDLIATFFERCWSTSTRELRRIEAQCVCKRPVRV
jgi:hypothetical protein